MVYFLTVLDVERGTGVGREALVRWCGFDPGTNEAWDVGLVGATRVAHSGPAGRRCTQEEAFGRADTGGREEG